MRIIIDCQKGKEHFDSIFWCLGKVRKLSSGHMAIESHSNQVMRPFSWALFHCLACITDTVLLVSVYDHHYANKSLKIVTRVSAEIMICLWTMSEKLINCIFSSILARCHSICVSGCVEGT
ncbi:hypothetical protein ACH5RR_016255 [Cinchona calisaya]|uniref:Uncharacterized protein n=1 Tax=Cinchona calisaya TaxID=153742 RepID=A0ABD2ZXG7_9GENT